MEDCSGQVQLTVKYFSNRTLPRFEKPIKIKVLRLEDAFDSRNLLPSTALDPIVKLNPF